MAHNGKRGQINLFFPQYDRAYPFINHLLTAQYWDYSDNSGRPDVAFMNAQGFPKNLNSKTWRTLFYKPISPDYAGNWIIDWIGECTVGLTGTSTVSGSNTGVNGRWVVTQDTANPTFTISAINVANPPTQIRIYRADHEAALLAGEVYTPLFIEKMAKAGVIRPMDYQLANTSNIGKWEDNTPVDYFSYACSHWDITKDAGSTSHTGDAYTATLSGFTLTDKAKVHVKWDFTNTTTTPTIDVEGTGAKVIKSPRAGTLATGALVLGRRDTLTYDEGLDCYLNTAILSVTEFDEGIIGGVPPEILLRLANDTSAHIDLSVPVMACDTLTGVTDYVSSLATLCAATLNSGLKARPQIGNELFNSAAAFHAGPYATAKGLDRWGAVGNNDANFNWHGRALSLVGAAFTTAYSGTGKEFDLRAAQQSSTTPDITSVRSTIVESPRHVSDGGTIASNYITHICMANYWGSRDRYPSTEASFMNFVGDAWAWFNGSAATKAALIEGFYTGAQAFIDGTGASRLTTWHDCAQHYGKKLTFYEGGNSEDTLAANPRQRVLGISKAAQAVVTMPSGHGFRSGMKAIFRSIQGMTEVNDQTYDVTASDDTTFTIDVDSTAFTTFSGGTGASNFSTADPTLRGVGFAGDGILTGAAICNQYCNAVSQAEIVYLYTMKNLRQHIALSDCEFPSQYHFCGDSVFSAHPSPDFIYGSNAAWEAFEHFSTNKARYNLQCVA